MSQCEHRRAQQQHGLYGRNGRLVECFTEKLLRSPQEPIAGGLLHGWIVVNFNSIGEFRNGEIDRVEQEMGEVWTTCGHIAREDYLISERYFSAENLRGR